MLSKLLTMGEVAAVLNITVPRAYELARLGILPVVKLGRQVRVDELKLAAWIEAGGAALPGGWRREA